MTVYELIKRSLQKEAVRSEPDRRRVLQKVLKELERKWKKKS